MPYTSLLLISRRFRKEGNLSNAGMIIGCGPKRGVGNALPSRSRCEKIGEMHPVTFSTPFTYLKRRSQRFNWLR